MYLLLAQQIAFFTVYVFIACPTDAAYVFLVLMKHDILA
jgi:hypothetical protein